MTNHEAGQGSGAAGRALHPIGVVSARTGLSPDVIRVWERRYGVVEPVRDDAGRRVYTDGDVERLRLLAEATTAGRGIGQVSALEEEELRALVREDQAARWSGGRRASADTGGAEASAVVERALGLTRELDGPALEAELRRSALLLGLAEFLDGVVAPLFRRIGDEWHAGRLSVAQEHLASGVAGAVVARLAGVVGDEQAGPTVVVATPAGEHHEIGALLVSAAASAEGWRVAYLGPNVPATDIVGAARATEARCVALSAVYANGRATASEVSAVRAGLPAGVDVLVGGASSRAMEEVTGVTRLEDLDALRAYLRSRTTGPGP
jgi:MerR family transcriptional regulator, light-induced transcriptional regulator